MRRLLITPLLALLLVCTVSSADAADTGWSALVIANNSPQPTPIPNELDKLQGTLKRFFNYNQYQVIGQSHEALKTGDKDWQTASKYFSLHVNSKPDANSAYRLNLQLFQEQKLLLETEA
ncbi:MAG: hypothetical protein H0U43_00955, partial [Chthoniobacterales bacterium]|nr:hypothetical protein [Chthoniobacterales bacterium]